MGGDRPTADDQILNPEVFELPNTSIKSGDRSKVALHVPAIAHQLDRRLKLLAHRGPSPESEGCLGQRLEARDAAENEALPTLLAPLFLCP